jgi:hypothetical protein
MSPDPNAVYKQAFAELSRELGRVPTCAESLPLDEEYKKAWAPAEETVTRESTAAGRPGFSRQPAPQARTEEEGARTREVDRFMGPCGHSRMMGDLLSSSCPVCVAEPLSAPRITAEGEEAVSPQNAASSPPTPLQGVREGSRGPAGGLILRCHQCRRLWERPATRGRPSFKCPECRR